MLKLKGSIANKDHVFHAGMPEAKDLLHFFGFGDFTDLDYFKVILSRAEVVVIYSREGQARQRAKLELMQNPREGTDPHYDICHFLGVNGMYVTRVTLTLAQGEVAQMDIEAEPLLSKDYNPAHTVQVYKIKEQANA